MLKSREIEEKERGFNKIHTPILDPLTAPGVTGKKKHYH